jgi:hypothetical protein
MTSTLPIREVWVCAKCGAEKVVLDPFTPLGQYRTGLCKTEGKNRPLILKSAMPEGMIERNQRREFLHKVSQQMRRGTIASHSYHAGERTGKGSPPCAWPQQPPCTFTKSSHPSQEDLEELRWHQVGASAGSAT